MNGRQALYGAGLTVAATGALLALTGVNADATPLPAGCTASGTTVTCDYRYTGGEQTFVAPAGITSYDVTAVGAAGGIPAGFGSRSQGASVSGTVVLTPGTTYYVNIGGAGDDTGFGPSQPGGAGGYNGGGRGAAGDTGSSAAYPGGGGATSLQIASGECNLSGALAVAGGGGGSNGFASNGGSAGLNGTSGAAIGRNTGGGGGTQTAGGAAGTSMPAQGPVQAGASCHGGNSGLATPPAVNNTQRGGGGGGGGYFGGGGGGNGSGGGGGSSLVPVGGTAVASPAPASLRITYNDPTLGASAVEPVVGLGAVASFGAVLIVGSRRRTRVARAGKDTI